MTSKSEKQDGPTCGATFPIQASKADVKGAGQSSLAWRLTKDKV